MDAGAFMAIVCLAVVFGGLAALWIYVLRL